MPLHVSSTVVLIIRRPKLYYTASSIVTPVGGCPEHMCTGQPPTGSVNSTGYPLHSPVSPSLPLPCVTVCHYISTGVYEIRKDVAWTKGWIFIYIYGCRCWKISHRYFDFCVTLGIQARSVAFSIAYIFVAIKQWNAGFRCWETAGRVSLADISYQINRDQECVCIFGSYLVPMFEGLMDRLCTNINNIYCYYFFWSRRYF